jgi:hypothetical protein
LDELAKAGAGGADIVQGFVSELARQLTGLNDSTARLRLLLIGRPGAAAATEQIVRGDEIQLRLQGLVLDLSEAELSEFTETALGADYRHEWWQRYGFDTGIPEPVREAGRQFDELTAQPMLNYLLAQMIRLKAVSDTDPLRNVHSLYSKLFQLVIRRRHRSPPGAPTTEAIDRLDEDELYRALEEIAVCAWHAGSRSVTESAVRRRFEGERLTGPLSKLTGESSIAQSKGLSIILDSFFCSPMRGGEEKTFEWNHKSFGEYLTARRIRREIEEACRRLAALDEEETREAVLKRWFALCGPIELDFDLLSMLRAELAAFGPERCRAWKRMLTGLLQQVMDHGFRVNAPQRTGEIFREARNAEIALLACLNGCVLALPVDDPERCIALDLKGFQAIFWLHYLLGPQEIITVSRNCLSFIDFSGNFLSLVDFYNTDLTGVDLTGAYLSGADLTSAVLCSTRHQ